jgi:Fic family protein
MAIRHEGDWEGWLRFFLTGVAESATEATENARAVNDLRERTRNLLQSVNAGMRALDLLDVLFQRPLVNVNLVKDTLGVAFLTANRLVERFVDMRILDEVTGAQRNRLFRYSSYLSIFEEHDDGVSSVEFEADSGLTGSK